MLNKYRGLIIAIWMTSSVHVLAIRIVCVGDSITSGFGAESSAAYPSQLVTLLDGVEQLDNFGVIGDSLMKKNKPSYWDAPFINKKPLLDHIVADVQPNLILLMLGTNDARPGNWSNKAEFISDYCAMVKILRTSRSHPTIYALIPIPAFGNGGFGISPNLVENEVVPAVKEAAAKMNVPVIDLNIAFKNSPELVGDFIHPNAAGYKFMAKTIANALRQTPIFSPPSKIFLPSVMVSLKAPMGGEVHFTLDGSLPTEGSPVYHDPMTFSDTTVVTASVFSNGKLGLASQSTYTKASPAPSAAIPGPLEAGLSYSLYQGVAGQIWRVDWEESLLVKKGNVAGIELSPRTQDEWFALQFSGFIKVPTDGIYTFYTDSVNGSRLTIGNDVIVENDGYHPLRERSGQVALQAGLHPFNLRYLHENGPIGNTLHVSWEGPSLSKQEIPDAALGRLQSN